METSQHELLAEGEPYIAAKFPHRTIPWTFYLGNGETYDGFHNRKLDQHVMYRIFVRAFVDTPQKVINHCLYDRKVYFFRIIQQLTRHRFLVMNYCLLILIP